MKIFQFIFLTASLGAAPVAIKLGQFSLSGLFTAIICFAAVFLYIQSPKVFQASLAVIVPLFLFWVWSLIKFLTIYDVDEKIDNYIFVWSGILFLVLLSAKHINNILPKIETLLKTIKFCSFIYIVVLFFMLITRGEDPATSQVGIIFFSFYLVKMFNGDRISAIPLFVIIFMHLLLGARIVVFAEIFIMFFGKILLNGVSMPRFRNFKLSGVFLASIFVGVIFFSMTSGVATKTFDAGDRGIEVYGTTINKIGRASCRETV